MKGTVGTKIGLYVPVIKVAVLQNILGTVVGKNANEFCEMIKFVVIQKSPTNIMYLDKEFTH